jgi:ubiquinone/menaquinone biosynthesis C-methylase UbiE
MDMSKSRRSEEFFQSNVDDYKKEHYESGYRTFMSARHERYLEEIANLGLRAGSVALDAGCGPGFLTKALHDRNYQVTALDTSPEMLRLTRSLFKNESPQSIPQFHLGNVEALPFEDGAYDLVLSAGVIEYLDNDLKALSEFSRVSKDNAALIISVTNKFSPAGYLDAMVEALKRNRVTLSACNWMLRKMGRLPARPRNFLVRKHSPEAFVESVEKHGYRVAKSGYFYVLPWPHPFDRIFPKASSLIGTRLEFLSRTRLGIISEGFYVVAMKTTGNSTRIHGEAEINTPRSETRSKAQDLRIR